MSLYNMVMGRNPVAPVLLGILGFTKKTAADYDLGRIRDVWINKTGDRISILHRNYDRDNPGFQDGAAGATINAKMATHPLFVRQYRAEEGHPDALGDDTYQVWEFRVPEAISEANLGPAELRVSLNNLAEVSDTEPPYHRFLDLVAAMQRGDTNPAIAEALERSQPLVEQLEKFMAAAAGTGDVTVAAIAVDGERPQVG